MPPRGVVVRAVLGAGLAALVLGALVLYADPRQVVASIGSVSPLALLAFVLVYPWDWALRGGRWGVLVGLPWRTALRLSLVGNALNVILPAKAGDVARAAGARRVAGVGLSRLAAVGVADRAYDVIAVAALALGGLLVVPGVPGGALRVVAVVALAVAGVVIASALLWLARARPSRSRVGRIAHDFATTAADFARRPGRTAALLAASLAGWGAEVAASVILARGMGLDAEPAVVALAVVLATLAKIVPLTPGGFGTYEAAVTATLGAAAGVSPASAVAFGLLDNGLKNGLALAAGAAAASARFPRPANAPPARDGEG